MENIKYLNVKCEVRMWAQKRRENGNKPASEKEPLPERKELLDRAKIPRSIRIVRANLILLRNSVKNRSGRRLIRIYLGKGRNCGAIR